MALVPAKGIDWDGAWQRFCVDEAIGLRVGGSAPGLGAGAMSDALPIAVALAAFALVLHAYVQHTGGIVIRPDGIFTLIEKQRLVARVGALPVSPSLCFWLSPRCTAAFHQHRACVVLHRRCRRRRSCCFARSRGSASPSERVNASAHAPSRTMGSMAYHMTLFHGHCAPADERTLHERSSKLLRARSWVWAPMMAYDTTTWVVYCTVLVLYMAPRRHHITMYTLINIFHITGRMPSPPPRCTRPAARSAPSA